MANLDLEFEMIPIQIKHKNFLLKRTWKTSNVYWEKTQSMGQIQAIIATECLLIFPHMEDRVYWEVCGKKLDFYTLVLMKGCEEKRNLSVQKMITASQ